MVDAADRRRYLRTLHSSLEPGGDVVIATFGPDGPTQCSNLPVVRYEAEELAATIVEPVKLVSSQLQTHPTPSGASQQFLYAHLASTASR